MAYIPGFGHLSNPYIVFNDANGKPLSNGTVETYIAGTTTAYNTLKDWNGTYNGAIITLDIYGGCTIIAPETQGLKLIVKTSTGSLYKTFPNVFIGGSNQGYLPGTTTIRVDGTDGEIISVGTPDPDDPDKLIFTISLDPAITTQINNNTANIANLSDDVDNIDTTINTLITGPKAARSFPLSLTETHYLKICDVDTDGTIPYHLDFLLYLSKNQLSLKFDEDVQGLMGTGTGSFKYLGQSCNPVFVYDVTPNTGRLVIFRTTPVDGKVSFFLVSYNGYDLESETVSIIDGHISGTTAVFSADAYTETVPVMAGNSETIYLTHNIRVGTSCSGLGTYYSPIEAKATQIISSDETVDVSTMVTDGVTTHDLSITGGQVDTYKVRTSSADATPGFTYDKIIVEGILTKNKAASDTFGEVLQLAVLDKSVESINVIEVVENENHAATVIIPYGYFNKIANIRSTLSSLTLKMSELPDTDHAYSFHATMTPLSNLGITTFKVVGPGNSILAVGDTLTSKVIRFSAAQLNSIYATLLDQTLVAATAIISYVKSTHTLSVGSEIIILDGAATEDAYFVCSATFGVVTAIGAMEFDVPTLYRDVTWLGTAPALVGGKTYEISVVNGCAVIGGSV